MKVQRISLHDESDYEQRCRPEDHLPGGHHRRGQLDAAHFKQHVGERCARSSEHDPESGPERHEAVEPEQPPADHRHAAKRQQRTREFVQSQRFVGQHQMRE